MPRRNVLHHHRPAVGPASRFFVVLPFAQPTAFTAGCGLVRHSVSSPGTTGSAFLAPGYGCAPRAEWLRCYRNTMLPKGAHYWYKGDDGLWWLEKISASTTEDGVYLAQILDDPGPFKLPLFPARYTTSAGAVRGSSYLQVHVASAFSRGVQRNVDDSRGAAVISSLSRRRRSRQFSGFLGSPPWITSGG